MMFSRLITLLGLVSAAVAETIAVEVGNGGLTFAPNLLSANEGDTVAFHSYSGFGSHSVALSSFDTPCQPATDGFYSGIFAGTQDGSGMVGVINPPSSSDQNLAAYARAAEPVLRQTPPGAVRGGIIVSSRSTSSADPSPSPSSASAQPSATASVTSGSGTALSTATVTGSSTVPVSTAVAGTTASGGTGGGTGPTATTTTSGGGSRSERSVVLGLAVVLGGVLVALMV